MLQRTLTLVALAALVSAGCLGATNAPAEPQGVADAPALLQAADTALWNAPQTFPHPAFDYPTLTNPPAEGAPALWQPIPAAEVPEDVTGLALEAGTGGDHPGTGIALFGSLAIVPNRGDGTAIYDISTPTEPRLLSVLQSVGRDADTIAYPDGRLVVVLATGSGTLPVWDITDPENPELLAELKPSAGTHNVAVVPGTPILYNANSAGGGAATSNPSPGQGAGVTEIFDLSDPDDITHVQDWGNGYGCHDITFFITEEKQRAYCAGIEYTQIWDVADPLNPEVVANVPVHHGMAEEPSAAVPVARFSHLAMVNKDASVLIVGDETGGGVAPACDAHVEVGGQSVSGPLGNLYFYDISDETNPQLVGWFNPGNHLPSNPSTNGALPTACTAHFGRVVPHATQDLVVMGYYGAGVVLVDFTDAANPKLVDQFNEGAEVWDAWYYNGYVFTGDQLRGMDVLTLE